MGMWSEKKSINHAQFIHYIWGSILGIFHQVKNLADFQQIVNQFKYTSGCIDAINNFIFKKLTTSQIISKH